MTTELKERKPRKKPEPTLFCNCCSAGFKQFPEQAPLKREHDENLCPKCFFTEEYQASLQWMGLFSDVSKSFKNSLNRFKFTHKPFEEKMHICSKLMEQGVISFRI